MMNSLLGLRIVTSHHVPKRAVEIKARTDDMRQMLEDIGAEPQYRLVDQVIIMGGHGGEMIMMPDMRRRMEEHAKTLQSTGGVSVTTIR